MTNLTDRTYIRNVLFQSDSFEIVNCEWTKNSISPLHAHDWSACYVLVQEGVFENMSSTGMHVETTIHEVGQVISTPIGADHEIKCLSEKGKTLHVYVPKIVKTSHETNLSPAKVDDLLKVLELDLTQKGVNWSQLKSSLDRIQRHSLTTTSPYFMNQLFSGVLPEMLVADEVIAKTKSTMATFEASPSLTLVEMEVIKKLGQQIGWRTQSVEGITVPGGSAANFMAVHCARQKKFKNFKTEGLPAGTKIKIFVSDQAHYSLKKASVVLGFGSNSLVAIKTDSKGRMLTSDLEEQIKHCLHEGFTPLMVCATAGTTVQGAFDPINTIAEICKAHDIWLHVDGAWGGPVIFSEKHRHLIQGIEKADSFTFDAHKLFGANLTCSFFLTQHPTILLEANDTSGAEYLFHEGSEVIDRGRLSWQCGRQAEALSFWTIWKSAGTAGLDQYVNRLMEVQEETTTWIKHQERLELMTEPDYLNICVRIKPPSGSSYDVKEWSKLVRNRLREKNLAMVNFSVSPDNTSFLRLILAHPKIDFKITQQILNWALEIQ
ncbi:MAG: aminotransferase class V-fold PLP-dependent enzyme [Pseudobdellovibrio sp.]